jgi:hypothetical protein
MNSVLITHHAMETRVKSASIAPLFLTSEIGGREWSVSWLGRFNPQGESPLYALDRRLGGPQCRSGPSEGKKNFFLLPGMQPQPSKRSKP